MELKEILTADKVTTWFKVAETSVWPEEGGMGAIYKGIEIAVFNFTSKGEWFACQNLCPHKKEMILSRGIIGDKAGIPKVACPFHKKQFSLHTGECLDDSSCGPIDIYPVKIENDMVYVGIE